jgi:hypothetical protein
MAPNFKPLVNFICCTKFKNILHPKQLTAQVIENNDWHDVNERNLAEPHDSHSAADCVSLPQTVNTTPVHRTLHGHGQHEPT